MKIFMSTRYLQEATFSCPTCTWKSYADLAIPRTFALLGVVCFLCSNTGPKMPFNCCPRFSTSLKDVKFHQLDAGHPYVWVQRICGLDFPSLHSETHEVCNDRISEMLYMYLPSTAILGSGSPRFCPYSYAEATTDLLY